MARRHGSGGFSRGSRRLTRWTGLIPLDVTQSAAGSTLVFVLSAVGLALRPFTIVRTHLELGLRSDQAAAIETQIAGFGMAVVSEQASAAGVASVPTPVTELESDLWFLHTLMYADAGTLTDGTIGGQFKSIDSKAMRKVEDGQDVVGVLERSAADGLIMTVGFRMLLKLH